MSYMDPTAREERLEQAAIKSEEQREELIHNEAHKKFSVLRAAIINGDEAAADVVCSALFECLSESSRSLDRIKLARTALSGSPDMTGKAFVELLVGMMKDQAREAVTVEVDRKPMEGTV